MHECYRNFSDRLTNEKDRTDFTQMLLHLADEHCRGQQLNPQAILEKGPLIFGDFFHPGAEDRIYEESSKDLHAVEVILREAVETYNGTKEAASSPFPPMVFLHSSFTYARLMCCHCFSSGFLRGCY